MTSAGDLDKSTFSIFLGISGDRRCLRRNGGRRPLFCLRARDPHSLRIPAHRDVENLRAASHPRHEPHSKHPLLRVLAHKAGSERAVEEKHEDALGLVSV